jgi:hypothetical protein
VDKISLFYVKHSDLIKRHLLGITLDTYATELWMKPKSKDHGLELSKSISYSREQETLKLGL